MASKHLDDDDIPDDFFDDLADNKFLDELLENVGPDESNDMAKESNLTDENRSSSPLMERCLKEIDKLTKDIQRKKKKLQRELSGKEVREVREGREGREGRLSDSPTRPAYRPKNRSRSNERRNRALTRGRRSRSRSRSPTSTGRIVRRRASRSHSRSPHGRRRSRSPHNRRRKSVERRRSRSPERSANKAMSFLEELNMKFAEQGQPFPEKDLLIAQNSISHQTIPTSYNANLVPNPAAMQVGYAQQNYPIIPMTADQQYAYAQNYVPNPLAFSQSGMIPIAYNQSFMPATVQPVDIQQPSNPQGISVVSPADIERKMQAIRQRPINSTYSSEDLGEFDIKPATNKDQVLARCQEAVKILRAEENKVPKLRFTLTRTSMQFSGVEDNASPLHSLNNVEFNRTSKTGADLNPLRSLSNKSKEITKVLGVNCAFVFSQLRMKELSNKVLSELDNTNKEKIKKIEKPILKAVSIQTDDDKCDECEMRASITFTNRGVQANSPSTLSIRTQTDEQDYRGPLLKTLNLMTSAQLIAMADFAKVISTERPTNTEEMFQLRERLMDVYNLGQRDADAVREAERKRRKEEERNALLFQEARQNNHNRNNSPNMSGNRNMNMSDNWQGDNWNIGPNNPPAWDSGPINRNDIRMNMNNSPLGQNLGQMAPNMNMNDMNMMDRDFINDRRRFADEHLELMESEEMEKERELRYQQAQYERDLRAYEAEEQRLLQDMQNAQRFEEEDHQRSEGSSFNWRGRGRGGNNNFRGRPYRGRFNR